MNKNQNRFVLLSTVALVLAFVAFISVQPVAAPIGGSVNVFMLGTQSGVGTISPSAHVFYDYANGVNSSIWTLTTGDTLTDDVVNYYGDSGASLNLVSSGDNGEMWTDVTGKLESGTNYFDFWMKCDPGDGNGVVTLNISDGSGVYYVYYQIIPSDTNWNHYTLYSGDFSGVSFFLNTATTMNITFTDTDGNGNSLWIDFMDTSYFTQVSGNNNYTATASPAGGSYFWVDSMIVSYGPPSYIPITQIPTIDLTDVNAPSQNPVWHISDPFNNWISINDGQTIWVDTGQDLLERVTVSDIIAGIPVNITSDGNLITSGYTDDNGQFSADLYGVSMDTTIQFHFDDYKFTNSTGSYESLPVDSPTIYITQDTQTQVALTILDAGNGNNCSEPLGTTYFNAGSVISLYSIPNNITILGNLSSPVGNWTWWYLSNVNVNGTDLYDYDPYVAQYFAPDPYCFVITGDTTIQQSFTQDPHYPTPDLVLHLSDITGGNIDYWIDCGNWIGLYVELYRDSTLVASGYSSQEFVHTAGNGVVEGTIAAAPGEYPGEYLYTAYTPTAYIGWNEIADGNNDTSGYIPAPTTMFYLTVISSVGGTTNTTSGWYLVGTPLVIQEYPFNNYGFTAFEVDGVNYTYNPISLAMDSDHTVKVFDTVLQHGSTSIGANPSQWLSYWLSGQFLLALAAPFLGTLGTWFYAFLLITIMMISWFKTKSIFMLGFLSCIYSILMIAVIPLPLLTIVYWIMAFAFAYVLIKIFASSG